MLCCAPVGLWDQPLLAEWHGSFMMMGGFLVLGPSCSALQTARDRRILIGFPSIPQYIGTEKDALGDPLGSWNPRSSQCIAAASKVDTVGSQSCPHHASADALCKRDLSQDRISESCTIPCSDAFRRVGKSVKAAGGAFGCS